MRIVLANQWYPPESGWGGVAMWNHTLAQAYRALGHDVTVVAARDTQAIPSQQNSNGIGIHRLYVRNPYRLRRLPGAGRYVRPAQQLLYSWRVDRLLRELEMQRAIDVVEFADVNAEGFFCARNPRVPVVVRCHTPTFVLKRYYTRTEMPYDTHITTRCEQDQIRRAHALTAPSHDMARVIAAECQLPVESITVIPNALSLFASSQAFERAHGGTMQPGLTILHVGRLERAKGVTVLAEAIPQIIGKVPSARFIFVGDDRPSSSGTSQLAELRAQLAKAQVVESVSFLGSVPQDQLLELYCRADICVVPSMLYESFSYTCAQGMAAGKPVVASRIGGIPETVEDGATGLIVEPGDVGALAEAIVSLARDPDMRERMGCAGREKVRCEFDPVKVARQNLAVYERAAKSFAL